MWIGVVLMSTATSLPEVFTTVSAAWLDAPDLAAGDLFGAGMSNMLTLGLIDLMHRQKRVWRALREIPAGGKATYAEIARRIGAPNAVRAVAGACAANRLAVAIPCHRVVRSDGGLSGYRWGVERKRALLEREAG